MTDPGNHQKITTIFIIDQQKRIVYLNEPAHLLYPDLNLGDMIAGALRLQWKNMIFTSIEWPGYGPCTLLLGHETAAPLRNRLTGLYDKDAFLMEASRFLSDGYTDKYCIIAIDIEHFKLFNDWYGVETGDEFLKDFGAHLSAAEKQYHGVAGYMGGDDFVILIPRSKSIINAVEDDILNCARQHSKDIGFRPIFGIYPVKGTDMPVSTMYDRAIIAMSLVKGNYTSKDAWYEDIMKTKMEDDQILLSDVQRAIENEEFIFYAQPKCCIASGKIVGLESLVRWNHPERGILPPGAFIPLLEQCGLITSLDLYIWELVCRQMRSWLDSGFPVIPVSVNVSRIDIYSIDIPGTFRQLVSKYRLCPKLIEIEITESSYVQEYNTITKIVDTLKSYGFTVLMDDFGSGYSSLNMLKDVNVDILKMDMMFLQMDKETKWRGMSILKTITSLAANLKMPLIAEGVETKEQAEFLENIGCVYAQGSYFYQPLSVPVFESLLGQDVICYGGIKLK